MEKDDSQKYEWKWVMKGNYYQNLECGFSKYPGTFSGLLNQPGKTNNINSMAGIIGKLINTV